MKESQKAWKESYWYYLSKFCYMRPSDANRSRETKENNSTDVFWIMLLSLGTLQKLGGWPLTSHSGKETVEGMQPWTNKVTESCQVIMFLWHPGLWQYSKYGNLKLDNPVLNMIISLMRIVTVATELLTITFPKEGGFKSTLNSRGGVSSYT